MKKTMKILSVLMLVVMIASICTSAFAAVSIDSIKSKADGTSAADDSFQNLGGVIIAYVTNAAMVISVVMIAVLGVKYMLGSSEEKAEYKKSLVPLLVGAVLVFGAAAIAKIVVNLATSFKNS